MIKIFFKKHILFSNLIVGATNILKLHNNVIFYDELNRNVASKICKKRFSDLPSVNLYACNTHSLKKIKYSNKYKKIAYIGRIEQAQKNIKFLIKTAKYLKYPIDVYGAGPLVKRLKNAKNINYCGLLNRKKVISTYSKYLASINVSKFEGVCFSAIEGMAAGTPPIVRNTFCFAKELASTSLLLDKKLSPKQCAKRINEYLDNLDSKKAFKDCQELALKNYTEEVFTKKWNDIIKNYEHYLHTQKKIVLIYIM